MLFLWYRHADDAVFDDFPQISEDFQKLFRRRDERFLVFSEHFPKITEDCRRRSKDVPIIHQQI